MRKVVFWTHLAAGCVAGAVILIMSVTGVLLAYERQIVSWVDRDLRPSRAGNTRIPVESIAENAAAVAGTAPSSITLRSDPGSPAEIGFGRDRVLLADPYSGAVIGESAPKTRAFFQQVEDWHRWLAAGPANRSTARAITGACNFAFLFLVVSGPFLWLPRTWSRQKVLSALTFRPGLAGRARDFNWHNVIGIWCAIPLLVVTLSGVVMSYPWANNLLYRLTASDPPPAGGGGRPNAARAESNPPNLTGLNPYWLKAERQVSGWKSVTLRLPASPRAPLAFTIDTGDGGRPDLRSQLTLDRRTGEIVRWEPFSTNNAGRRARSWLRFLHTGEAGGIACRTIAAAASAGGTVLVWTGLCLAWRRFRSGPARRSRAAAN